MLKADRSVRCAERRRPAPALTGTPVPLTEAPVLLTPAAVPLIRAATKASVLLAVRAVVLLAEGAAVVLGEGDAGGGTQTQLQPLGTIPQASPGPLPLPPLPTPPSPPSPI